MNEFQRDIVCLEWRPLSGTNLAVGCRNGVCLWKVLTPASDRGWSSPTSSGQIPPFRQAGLTGSSTAHVRPSFYQSLAKSTSAIMAFLAHPAMENISCISWSPDGSFLAVGSQDSPVLLVWNVSLETATVLRKAVGHGTTNLSWSPNGRYLLQLCRMKTMRIWETDSFTSIDLETTICFTAACWLYDSRTVLFSVSGNPRINMLQMARKPPSLDYRMHPQAERVPKTPSLTKKGFPVVVGGNVSAMEIDPTGRRLAVTFANGSTPGAELIAMFEIKLSPLPELNLIGFVRGPSWQSRPLGPCPVPEELFGDRQPERSPLYDRNDGSEEDYVVAGPKPLSFKFTSKTTKGTVLAIAWESGHVSFLPCGQ
ncbi:WD40-repeat-containing domain protein [Zopfochytrium polystomum]|nr:WD40-repeat-containing domain protein [Zopfochytrium polystomum]